MRAACPGARGIFMHFLYPRACRCVAVLTVRKDNLLPFVSQSVYIVLQTTHVFSKRACPVHAHDE